MQYLVKWVSYDECENLWLTAIQLDLAKEILEAYQRQNLLNSALLITRSCVLTVTCCVCISVCICEPIMLGMYVSHATAPSVQLDFVLPCLESCVQAVRCLTTEMFA